VYKWTKQHAVPRTGLLFVRSSDGVKGGAAANDVEHKESLRIVIRWLSTAFQLSWGERGHLGEPALARTNARSDLVFRASRALMSATISTGSAFSSALPLPLFDLLGW
jgi:hypothetical protein